MNLTKSYANLINDIKEEIQRSRIKAHLSVNKELILLYWKIGKRILDQQQKEGWGSKVIETISNDLRRDFPEMKGFSAQNLAYMRQFSSEYSKNEISQQAVGEIPWGHNIQIFSKVKNRTQRLWYAQKTLENNWSRNILILQIKTNLYEREGKALTNFKSTLPTPQSDLALQMIKDPYHLEFLNIEGDFVERHLENKLIQHMRNFLLELGSGFAFIGNQYHIPLEEEDYYLDLLFYHVRLKCYVVIELKSGKFKPEYAGKLNFYLNLVDKKIKDLSDNPTIGLLLCEDKQGMTVEYAIEGINTPLSVSGYQLTKNLPKGLEGILPNPNEISRKLNTKKLEKAS